MSAACVLLAHNAYVHNNPLRFVDPSGFGCIEDQRERGAEDVDVDRAIIEVCGRRQREPRPRDPTEGRPSAIGQQGDRNQGQRDRQLLEIFQADNYLPDMPSNCGAEGGVRFPNNPGGFSVNDECDAHDDCFSTLGANMSDCNAAFGRDIFAAVTEQGGDRFTAFMIASTYFVGVSLGGKAFYAAQNPRQYMPYRSNGGEWARLQVLGR